MSGTVPLRLRGVDRDKFTFYIFSYYVGSLGAVYAIFDQESNPGPSANTFCHTWAGLCTYSPDHMQFVRYRCIDKAMCLHGACLR
jgi:hypothetical protein